MHHKYFQTGSIGDDVGNVQGIAVTQFGGVETLPIVVNGCGAEDDLVPAVTVSIGNTQAVRAFATIISILVAVGDKGPAEVELIVS